MTVELLGAVIIVGLPTLIVGGLLWAYVGERRRERGRERPQSAERAPDASIEDVGVVMPRDGVGDRGPITGLGPGDQPSIGGF